MATSLDKYPNAYDLMAIKPIEEILNRYFCDIKWAYEFQEATLEEKMAMIREIALEIDRELNLNLGKQYGNKRCNKKSNRRRI